jgi:hypothetical protein
VQLVLVVLLQLQKTTAIMVETLSTVVFTVVAEAVVPIVQLLIMENQEVLAQVAVVGLLVAG